MATIIGKLPIYMRIGDSAEVHIGDFAPTVNPLGIAAEFTRADLAALLRSAADSLELEAPKGADAKE